MMAQLSQIFHEGKDYDKESARLYFESNDFLKHAEVLALDDIVVKAILTAH